MYNPICEPYQGKVLKLPIDLFIVQYKLLRPPHDLIQKGGKLKSRKSLETNYEARAHHLFIS